MEYKVIPNNEIYNEIYEISYISKAIKNQLVELCKIDPDKKDIILFGLSLSKFSIRDIYNELINGIQFIDLGEINPDQNFIQNELKRIIKSLGIDMDIDENTTRGFIITYDMASGNRIRYIYTTYTNENGEEANNFSPLIMI